MSPAPDVADPIGVWRVWRLLDPGDGPELVSPVRPVRWPARRAMTATCHQGCVEPPTATCRCGLYGMSELRRLLRESPANLRVLGCTALWGRVVEHRQGFRGQFGYPLLLFLLPRERIGLHRSRSRPGHDDDALRGVPTDTVARDLRQHYGVPVVVLPESAAGAAFPDSRCAQAVAAEAVRGLAGRRAGDHTAHARFADAVEDLVGRKW